MMARNPPNVRGPATTVAWVDQHADTFCLLTYAAGRRHGRRSPPANNGGIRKGRRVHRHRPKEVAAILRSARTAPHSAVLQDILAGFQTRWLCFATRRWPWLSAHHGAAVNAALQRVCERIDELADDDQVQHWADLQFISVMGSVRKSHKREAARTATVSTDHDDDKRDPMDRLASPGPVTEEDAGARERLRMVLEILQCTREGWQRLAEDLPADEVARLTGRTPEWIRTFTMRLRRAIRAYLEEGGSEGGPRSPEVIFGKSGLPKALVARIVALLEDMKDRPPR